MSQSANNLEIVWVSPKLQLPDTCCTCGMFTDQRVNIRHFEMVPGSEASGGAILLTIALSFLGPIGWILAAMNQPGEGDAPSLKKKKIKIRISQCRLCSGHQLPTVFMSRHEEQLYAFRVHPQFAIRFARVNERSKNQG